MGSMRKQGGKTGAEGLANTTWLLFGTAPTPMEHHSVDTV